MKKVSIIMSTYNTKQDFLFESIDSILAQTYNHFELIIICDGSNEEYDLLNKKYKDKRIKLYLNKKNKGLPYSLNKAIELSTGDYIARMDSDDICYKDRIEKQVEFLNKNDDIFICGTNARLFGDGKGIKSIIFNDCDEIKCQLLFKATLIHPTVMIRKEVFDEFKYDEDFVYSQDFELWSRIATKYKIKILPFVGIKYRIHNHQISYEKKNIQMKLCKNIIHNNSLYITNGIEDKNVEHTLWLLSGRNKIDSNDLKVIRKGINLIISYNGIENKYNKLILKKILYNRYFELSLKNKLFDFNSLKYYLHMYNFKDLFFKGIVFKYFK